MSPTANFTHELVKNTDGQHEGSQLNAARPVKPETQMGSDEIGCYISEGKGSVADILKSLQEDVKSIRLENSAMEAKILSQDDKIKSLQTVVGTLNARVQNHLAEKLNNLIVQVVYKIERSMIVEMFKDNSEYDYLKNESHFDIILEDPFIKQTIKLRILENHLYQGLK